MRPKPDQLASIIIPTWNRPELLCQRAIPSVLAQTHRNFDLHIIGDGCTPDTLERMVLPKDNRVRFTNRPRPKYPPGELDAWHVAGSWALNYGLATARGQFVAELGDDDEYLPTFIEEMLGALENADVAYCASEIITPDGGHNGFLGITEPPAFSRQSGGEWMWRRSSTRYDVNCWRDGEPNDWNFHRRLMAGKRVAHVRRVLYRYHPGLHIPLGARTLPW